MHPKENGQKWHAVFWLFLSVFAACCSFDSLVFIYSSLKPTKEAKRWALERVCKVGGGGGGG